MDEVGGDIFVLDKATSEFKRASLGLSARKPLSFMLRLHLAGENSAFSENEHVSPALFSTTLVG
jgi:hypothetical protein